MLSKEVLGFDDSVEVVNEVDFRLLEFMVCLIKFLVWVGFMIIVLDIL